jgi:hypothetical protein
MYIIPFSPINDNKKKSQRLNFIKKTHKIKGKRTIAKEKYNNEKRKIRIYKKNIFISNLN